MKPKNKNYNIVLHGGAGALAPHLYTPQEIKEYKETLEEAMKVGTSLLEKGGSSLQAVIESVVVLENSPLFNAGRGSVFSSDETIEMDASVSCGERVQTGGVTNVTRLKNPVLGAYHVFENSNHALLSGMAADFFCKKAGLEHQNESYFKTEKRLAQLYQAKEKNIVQLDHSDKMGTVGAVAIDGKGNLASATSTGGMTNRYPGRVSDTSIQGAGTYAENGLIAISGTGTGDVFIQNVFAYDMAAMMKYADIPMPEAAQRVLEKLRDKNGSGGLVAIDKFGYAIFPFNTRGMFRAWLDEDGVIQTGIFE
ncbi:MAG: isoaspartyl peptidase/L-asparaginase [Bacteriovoracaceae bacterium]|nr:isoaspartyl peptidase/L-asparaginase [Bacteriovoracaceae bacterium]